MAASDAKPVPLLIQGLIGELPARGQPFPLSLVRLKPYWRLTMTRGDAAPPAVTLTGACRRGHAGST